MAIHREPNESEKRAINKDHTREGKVRCFVNDHPIDNESEIEYHHIKPFSQNGPTEISNLAPVCRQHHKRIGTLSILEFRAKLELEDFFNNPEPRRLDDILAKKLGDNKFGKILKTEKKDAFFIAIFLLLNFSFTQRFLPSFGVNNLWFYSGIFMVLFSILFIENFMMKDI